MQYWRISDERQTTSAVRVQWLGQAGFILEFDGQIVVIDPYLSDSLAEKYAGSIFEHVRLYEAPVDPDELTCDLVICTHRHTDHMDGVTLRALVRANPKLRICVPRAEVGHARSIGIEPERIVEMSVGTILDPLPGLSIAAIPAAHETLSTDERGDHRFLGVVLSMPELRVYHSGDCVPYDGLAETLRDAQIDVAMLPVNGRDSYRLRNGVPGNFWIDEALGLCDEAQIPTLIGHHFGLFEFNSVSPESLDRAVAVSSANVAWIRPELNQWRTLLR